MLSHKIQSQLFFLQNILLDNYTVFYCLIPLQMFHGALCKGNLIVRILDVIILNVFKKQDTNYIYNHLMINGTLSNKFWEYFN